MKDSQDGKDRRPNKYIGLGLIFGAAIGTALGNVALGVGVGLLIGALLDYQNRKRGDDSDDHNPQ